MDFEGWKYLQMFHRNHILTILVIEMPYYSQIFSGSKIGALAARLQALRSGPPPTS